jgi:hypothetical protein
MLSPLSAQSTIRGKVVATPPQWRSLALQFDGEQPRPLTMVSGDFDEDGVADLMVGYATERGGMLTLLRGNPEAVAPRTEAGWLAAARHESPAPFLQTGNSIALTTQPSVMITADVNGDGHLDLVYATSGSNMLEVRMGYGNGSFQPNPFSVRMPGNITALAAYRPGAPLAGEAVLVAYTTSQGAKLSILSDGPKGAAMNATYSLPAPATQLAVANLDTDFIPDTAIVAGGKLLVLHGLNAINGTGQLQTLPFSGIQSVAAGQFLFDRHAQTQLSAANSSGEVLILAHQGFDSRPYTPAEIASQRQEQKLHPGSATLAQQAGNNGAAPWIEVESEPEAAAAGASAPILLRSRWSGSGGDDLMVLDSGRQTVIHHITGTQSREAMVRPELAGALVGQRRVSENFAASGQVLSALSMRLDASGRSGVVTLLSGKISPEFTVPSAGNTYYVNTTADNTGSTTDPDNGVRCSNGSGQTCTLRDAITFVNNDASDNISGGKSDTIMLPAGTYTLTWQKGVTDANSNNVTHLEVLGPVSIVGAGAGSTIIDGDQNDTVFTINPGIFGSFNPSGDSYVFDMSMSGLTIQHGKNNNNLNNNPNANDVGGGLNWDAFGTGNLTLTNTDVVNNTIFWGAGGGIWIENSAGGGPGTLILSGGTVSNNSTSENGGGVYVATPPATLSATNTVFNANVANPNVNSSDPGGFGDAGGLYFTNRQASPSTPQSVLNGVTITSNTAVEEGGGIETYSGILLENSLVSGNSTSDRGGGFYTEIADPEVAPTITSTNLLNNSATASGGGAYVGNDNPSSGVSLLMNLDRIFGNTSTSGTNGLATNSPGKATAKDNWWGCNGGPGASGCQNAGSGATTNPWAVFNFSATTATSITPGGSVSYMLTLDTDSNGAGIVGAFPAVNSSSYPITFSLTSALGTAPANAEFNSAGTDSFSQMYDSAGSGSITATFDNQTDSIPLTVSQITTSLSISASNYTYGQSPSYTVTLNPTNATGISASDFSVTVDGASTLDGSPFGVSLISGTEYAITGPFNLVSATSHSLAISFSGPSQYKTTSGSTPFNVSKAGTSVSGIVSPAKPIRGLGGSVAVTVTPTGTGAAPSGSVSYSFDGGSSSVLTLTSGSGTIAVPATLATGSHSLALTYSGDPNYLGSANTVNFTVLGSSQTTFASLKATSATIDVFGFGFTAPSGQLAFTDTTANSPVAAPVTLNTATATTAFTAQATTSTGANSLPDWTTLGDVNGDGILDLITSVYSTDSVNVQLGNGDGTFGAPTSVLIAAGFGPAENHLVSLRGNGVMDIIVGSFNTNQIAVLLGNGHGAFGPPSFYTSGTATNTPTSLTAFKLSPGAAFSVAVANTGDGTVSIFEGDNSGTLVLAGAAVPVGHDPEAIRTGDFNGDGYPDLAVANYKDGTVSILLNQQNSTFAASTLSTGSGVHSGPQALAINGSGSSLLLAVANYLDNTVSVFPSNGNGTFGSQSILPAGTGPDDVSFADFNGDSVPDLIVTNYTSGTVSLILGKSGGGYATQTQFPVGKNPYSAAVGDLDQDGTPDLVVSNCFSNNTGVLLSGTQIAVPYTGISLTAGHSLNATYTPDGASQYGASVSASTVAP